MRCEPRLGVLVVERPRRDDGEEGHDGAAKSDIKG